MKLILGIVVFLVVASSMLWASPDVTYFEGSYIFEYYYIGPAGDGTLLVYCYYIVDGVKILYQKVWGRWDQPLSLLP